MGLVRKLHTGNTIPNFNLVFDDYFETVHTGEDQEPPVWSELITFQYLRSEYDDEYYVTNLSYEWLEPEALEARRHQEAQRNPNIPGQEEEWPHDTEEKYLGHRFNYSLDPTPISDSVPREYTPR